MNRTLFGRFSVSMIIVIVALSIELRSPRFAYFRAVDVLLLFFSGVAFGAAVVTLVNGLRQRRQS
ncbi:MAG: hypothetical protein WB992_24830 [Bryobacteraceae bacterium]